MSDLTSSNEELVILIKEHTDNELSLNLIKQSFMEYNVELYMSLKVDGKFPRTVSTTSFNNRINLQDNAP